MTVPRHHSNDYRTILTLEQLDSLLNAEKKQARKRILGEDATVTLTGFVGTTFRAVITSAKAMHLSAKKRRDAQKAANKAAVAERREERVENRSQKWVKKLQQMKLRKKPRLSSPYCTAGKTERVCAEA